MQNKANYKHIDRDSFISHFCFSSVKQWKEVLKPLLSTIHILFGFYIQTQLSLLILSSIQNTFFFHHHLKDVFLAMLLNLCTHLTQYLKRQYHVLTKRVIISMKLQGKLSIVLYC